MVSELTIGGIILLALADSINPCEIAILALILISVLTATKSKTQVLKSGFAFILSVFILYFLYGLIMIGLFKTVALEIASIRIYLVKALGVFAMFLGLLNIKDFIFYAPGGFMTEMPLLMRPKMKRMVSSITSPKGAFVIGAFVTVFLLPCTIGPYIAASGILSILDFIKTVPWLLLYNFVFVLPMIIITLIIYLGFATVERVSSWKDRNIRYMHLATGLILFFLGLAMLMGWI